MDSRGWVIHQKKLAPPLTDVCGTSPRHTLRCSNEVGKFRENMMSSDKASRGETSKNNKITLVGVSIIIQEVHIIPSSDRYSEDSVNYFLSIAVLRRPLVTTLPVFDFLGEVFVGHQVRYLE